MFIYSHWYYISRAFPYVLYFYYGLDRLSWENDIYTFNVECLVLVFLLAHFAGRNFLVAFSLSNFISIFSAIQVCFHISSCPVLLQQLPPVFLLVFRVFLISCYHVFLGFPLSLFFNSLRLILSSLVLLTWPNHLSWFVLRQFFLIFLSMWQIS